MATAATERPGSAFFNNARQAVEETIDTTHAKSIGCWESVNPKNCDCSARATAVRSVYAFAISLITLLVTVLIARCPTAGGAIITTAIVATIASLIVFVLACLRCCKKPGEEPKSATEALVRATATMQSTSTSSQSALDAFVQQLPSS